MFVRFALVGIIWLLCFQGSLWSQEVPSFQKEVLQTEIGSLPYRILLPADFSKNKEYPLLIFLHGSGERGDDNELQLTLGADLFLSEEVRQKHQAIVVFPQCPVDRSWNNSVYRNDGPNRVQFPKAILPNPQQEQLEKLIEHLKATYSLNLRKLYIGGLSMGGMGTLELARRNPTLFAAAFSICGGAHPEVAGQLANTPIWLFHGDADTVIPVSGSKDLANALQKTGAPIRITVYPKVGHDSWTPAFAEPDLLPWLFSQEKKE